MSETSETPQQNPVYKAISRDGTVIAYERSGDGRPIIIVGGAAEMIPGARHRALDGGFHDVPPETLAPVLLDHLTAAS
ncbi:hypothetical protein ABIC28_001773 [Rhodococcus sp. PvR044]|uniref:hypothetical protein n=1 Tax=Rhodococcus sp. PvR044 TaxID=3156402 RepID=UPI0033954125